MSERWVPVPKDDARSIIGEGLHAGLRKGSDSPEAPALWRAINESDRAWSDSLAFLVGGLGVMGLALCRKAEDADEGRRMEAARQVAQYEIGDPSWADLIVAAYKDPATMVRLREEKKS